MCDINCYGLKAGYKNYFGTVTASQRQGCGALFYWLMYDCARCKANYKSMNRDANYQVRKPQGPPECRKNFRSSYYCDFNTVLTGDHHLEKIQLVNTSSAKKLASIFTALKTISETQKRKHICSICVPFETMKGVDVGG